MSSTFDEPTLRRFLSYIVDPSAGCTEMCCLKAQYDQRRQIVPDTIYNKTLAGWHDKIDTIVADARKVRGVSAYICPNPCIRDMMAVSYGRMTKVDSRTKDEHVVCLRWFYIDVDSVRVDGTSATDGQLAAAVALRDEILADHPDIRRAALIGKSGNGAFIFARLPDFPNDEEHRGLIADALESIRMRYGNPAAKIDAKTKNPGRLGCIPGMLKCKGSNIPGHEWKLATLDGVPDGDDPANVPTFDLRGWLARNPAPAKPAPAAQAAPQAARSVPPWITADHAAERARKCVFAMQDSVAGQGGHTQLYAVAVTLVDGFGLDWPAAHAIFRDWNTAKARPPESDRQVDHKLREAFKDFPSPSLKLLNADRPGWDADWGGGPPGKPYDGPCAEVVIGEVVRETGGTPEPASPPAPPIGLASPAIQPQPAGRPAREPHLPVEPIRSRAAHHAANAKIEDFYRDQSFLADLARVERENPGEAEAIKAVIGRIPGLKARGFANAMADHRRAAQRNGAGGNAPGGMGGPDESPFDPTDMGNADILLAAHGEHLRYVMAYGNFMVNDGKRWKEDREAQSARWSQEVPDLIAEKMAAEMDDDAVEAVRKWQEKSRSKERLAALLTVAKARVTVTPETFDRDPWLFNCQNGTIDLRTGEFREHRPGDFITKISPVVYDPDAACPTWDAFISRIMMDDPETVAYVHRIIGYAMTGIVKDHAIFICYGVGSNGKTVLLSTTSHIMGDYATDLDPEVILAQANALHPTGLTDLEGRRFVVCEETESKRGIAEALLKRITGGGRIRARKIGQNYYDFEPTHHLILATNHMPDVTGSDDGIWRRLKLIPFDMKFKAELGHPPDRDMPAKLRAEASGILNRMLAGFRDWQANGLADCPVVRQATSQFREESDTLGAFLGDRTVDAKDDPKAEIEFTLVWDEYVDWAKCEGIRHPLGKKKLGRLLNDRGFKTRKAGGKTYKTGLLVKINGYDPRAIHDTPGVLPFNRARREVAPHDGMGDGGDWDYTLGD